MHGKGFISSLSVAMSTLVSLYPPHSPRCSAAVTGACSSCCWDVAGEWRQRPRSVTGSSGGVGGGGGGGGGRNLTHAPLSCLPSILPLFIIVNQQQPLASTREKLLLLLHTQAGGRAEGRWMG